MSDKLRIYWKKRENALVYDGPSSTGGFLASIFERITMADMNGYSCSPECKRNGLIAKLHHSDDSDHRTLAHELEARGYDLTTLRFTIKKKQG